jgi:hypothetical protein
MAAKRDVTKRETAESKRLVRTRLMVSLADLTIEQRTALVTYATKATATLKADGVTYDWKVALQLDWMRSGSKLVGPDVYCYLQQIRNQKGPQWLAALDLSLPA